MARGTLDLGLQGVVVSQGLLGLFSVMSRASRTKVKLPSGQKPPGLHPEPDDLSDLANMDSVEKLTVSNYK
jgi:hypothetical protein